LLEKGMKYKFAKKINLRMGDSVVDVSPEEDSLSAELGRGCAKCVADQLDVPVFLLSFLILYLSVNRCCECVLVVAIVSALMCIRWRILNATLWSAIAVLYMHKNWNINMGDVNISWNRAK